MLLPNQCSFCAHQRIHAHKSPYCCPECGAPRASSAKTRGFHTQLDEGPETP